MRTLIHADTDFYFLSRISRKVVGICLRSVIFLVGRIQLYGILCRAGRPNPNRLTVHHNGDIHFRIGFIFADEYPRVDRQRFESRQIYRLGKVTRVTNIRALSDAGIPVARYLPARIFVENSGLIFPRSFATVIFTSQYTSGEAFKEMRTV